jgi:hypothetical protein
MTIQATGPKRSPNQKAVTHSANVIRPALI